MSKNGGKPSDAILSLEDALKRLKHQGHESGEAKADEPKADSPRSNVLQMPGRRGMLGSPTTLLSEDPREPGSSEIDSDAPGSDEIVALLDGVPRTFADLERMAELEEARIAEAIAEGTDTPRSHWYGTRVVKPGELAFTAMGAAMLVWVAFLVTYMPHSRTRALIASSGHAQPLKASTAAQPGDLINTLVILADSETQPVKSMFKPKDVEDRVKNELRAQAFSDIGVSVGKFRDVYLAGLVYSKEEAQSIERIVHRITGVRRVLFLHPDIHVAKGPAYFGATTVWSPDIWGAKVKQVTIGSPADKAGIQTGDVISEFDGNTIPDAKSFTKLLQTYTPGQRVRFRVWHNGEPQYLLARLGESSGGSSAANQQTAMR